VVRNLNTKEAKFERMYDSMLAHMRDLSKQQLHAGRIATSGYVPERAMELPAWL
jgi:hypothetical protein